jgi:hypothetical protein
MSRDTGISRAQYPAHPQALVCRFPAPHAWASGVRHPRPRNSRHERGALGGDSATDIGVFRGAICQPFSVRFRGRLATKGGRISGVSAAPTAPAARRCDRSDWNRIAMHLSARRPLRLHVRAFLDLPEFFPDGTRDSLEVLAVKPTITCQVAGMHEVDSGAGRGSGGSGSACASILRCGPALFDGDCRPSWSGRRSPRDCELDRMHHF